MTSRAEIVKSTGAKISAPCDLAVYAIRPVNHCITATPRNIDIVNSASARPTMPFGEGGAHLDVLQDHVARQHSDPECQRDIGDSVSEQRQHREQGCRDQRAPDQPAAPLADTRVESAEYRRAEERHKRNRQRDRPTLHQ